MSYRKEDDFDLAFRVFGTVFLCALAFVGIFLGCSAFDHDQRESKPKYVIHYLDNSGNVKYSKYTSFIRGTYGGGVEYKDFNSGQTVNTGGATIQFEELY